MSAIPIILARIRVPTLVAGVLLILSSPLHHLDWLAWLGVALAGFSIATTFAPGGYVKREPVPVHSPVQGRWIAVNSPADKVPSHGVHSAGQAYAIDLVHWPDPTTPWKPLHPWPLLCRPEEFPGFGQPIFAPADGKVVKTRNSWRDHWSRNSWPALVYATIEGSARELFGPGALLGNYVVIHLGDGIYAALAHLKRGSVTVEKGQDVRAGQQLAECGNSGNSSEPHLHFQLMDTARPAIAAGLPFSFVGNDVPTTRHPFIGNPHP
jgi:hypothetical protein